MKNIDSFYPTLKLRHLSIPADKFFDYIYNQVYHNGEIIVDTFYKEENEIEKDFLHAKETNIKISHRQANDLIYILLKRNIKVCSLDGSLENVIKSVSPPFYDKFYRK